MCWLLEILGRPVLCIYKLSSFVLLILFAMNYNRSKEHHAICNCFQHIQLVFYKTCEMRGVSYFSANTFFIIFVPLKNFIRSCILKDSCWDIIPMECHLLTIFWLCDGWNLLKKWPLAGDRVKGKNNQPISHM